MDQGTFSVEFFDYNDAHCALQLTRTLFYGQDIACYPMWPKDIAAKCGTNPYTTTNHVGEFLLSLCDIGVPTSAYTLDDLIQTCQDADSVPRQVKAVQIVQALPGTVATFRVEWSDSRTKAMALFARGFKVCFAHPTSQQIANSLRDTLYPSHPSPQTLTSDVALKVSTVVPLTKLETEQITSAPSKHSCNHDPCLYQSHRLLVPTMLLTSTRSDMVRTFEPQSCFETSPTESTRQP